MGNTFGGSVVTPYDLFPVLPNSLTKQSIFGTVATTRGWLTSADSEYNALVADGISLSVARPTQGQVIIDESGGISNGFTSPRGRI